MHRIGMYPAGRRSVAGKSQKSVRAALSAAGPASASAAATRDTVAAPWLYSTFCNLVR
jgi:hypothetical protein